MISPTAISPHNRRGGINWSSYWKALKAEMVNKPSAAYELAANTFITSLVDGGVWAKLDRLFVFATETNDDGEALLDWIHPAGTPAVLTFGSGGSVPTFTANRGFTGNVVNKSLINTQFNASISGDNYKQNSASYGVYMNTLSTGSSTVISLLSDAFKTVLQQSASRFNINNNAADYTNRAFPIKYKLLSVIRKDDSTSFAVFGGTAGSEIAAASASLENANFYVLGGYSNYYSDSQVSLAYMGSQLSEAECSIINVNFESFLYNIWDNIVGMIGDSVQEGEATRMSSDAVFIDVSAGGQTINQQLAEWQAIPIKRKGADVIFIMVGLNDVVANANIITDYQALVDAVRNDVGTSKKIVGVTLIPCNRSGSAGWTPLNNAIKGLGATPITGIDAYIDTVATALNAGDDTLAVAYDSGDHLHPNSAGKQIIADLYDAQLAVYGF